MKQNVKKDKIIECFKDNKSYAIEESKLFDFYISSIFTDCIIKEDNF